MSSSDEAEFEVKPPKKERTEAQKKATANMLLRLKEKRKETEEAIEHMKKTKAAEAAAAAKAQKIKELSTVPKKPAGRPKIPKEEIESESEPPVPTQASIDYDALASRVVEMMGQNKKKPATKKKVVVVEDSDSEESSEEEVVMVKKTKKAKEPAPQEPPAPAPFVSSGSRVLDSLFYNRRR